MGDIKAETVGSLMAFSKQTNLQYSLSIQKDTYIHHARNKAVWEAVNQGATHLMFIDADIAFPPDGIEKLLSRNKDIVGGLYFGRVAPFPVYKIKHKTENALANPLVPPKEELFEVEGIGTGFLLINMDVFKKIDPPFFYFCTPGEYGMVSAPFPNNELGEDVSFGLKARAAGFKVWCDQTIQLGHMGSSMVTRQQNDDWSAKEKEHAQFSEHDKIIQ
jgi:hypothetical protein